MTVKEIGLIIQKNRKSQGMTQPQLAKIENLDSIPTLPTLNKYAAGLGLQIKLSISPLMEAK